MIKQKATEKGYRSGMKILTLDELKTITLEMSKFASFLQHVYIFSDGKPF